MSEEEKMFEFHVVETDGRLRAIYPEARITAVPFDGDSSLTPMAADAMPRKIYDEPPTDSKAAPTPGQLPDDETVGYRWAPWGERDCLPTDIRLKIYKVPMAARAIYQLTQMMFGNGLAYVRNSDLQAAVDAGTMKVKRSYIPAIEQWLRTNRINTKWLAAQFIDYRFYMNSFSEIIFNKRRDQVTGIYHKPAEFCRLSTQDPATLKINWLYFSPEFAEGRHPRNDEIRRVQLYQWEDPQYVDRMIGYKFAWHSRFETPGITYYARPFWLGLFRKNGWLDASASVPEIVNAMMRNQIVLKYHILIPESYFEIRYPEWHNMEAQQRNKFIDDTIDDINTALAGTKNAFASIATVFKHDFNQQPLGKIEIIAVDDKVKKDAWVPSSDRADAQIVQSLGLHPSQVGLAPEGGKMGAGSGSDQRESFNTGITLNTIDQEIILEPLNWIARFNAQTDPAWDVTFYIDHTWHTTTNRQESGIEPGDSTIQIEE